MAVDWFFPLPFLLTYKNTHIHNHSWFITKEEVIYKIGDRFLFSVQFPCLILRCVYYSLSEPKHARRTLMKQLLAVHQAGLKRRGCNWGGGGRGEFQGSSNFRSTQVLPLKTFQKGLCWKEASGSAYWEICWGAQIHVWANAFLGTTWETFISCCIIFTILTRTIWK